MWDAICQSDLYFTLRLAAIYKFALCHAVTYIPQNAITIMCDVILTSLLKGFSLLAEWRTSDS